jgi:hypothetical protein
MARQKVALGPVTRRLRRLRPRSTKPPYDPRDPTFWNEMREAFAQLRADPVALEEWMEELVIINPLALPPSYLEERERRLKAAEAERNRR